MTSPVPWCLEWVENGELAPQDRFDLPQTLVASEKADVQPALVAAVERLTVTDLTLLTSTGTTRLCA